MSSRFSPRGCASLACLSIAASVAAAAPLPADEALPTDEARPAAAHDCFPGAIYRKAVSSVDVWTGIEAELVLPTFTTDPRRVNPANARPLDNASCYLGGNAGGYTPEGTEIDCGVSWEVVREPDGSVSKQRKAFRPFWRNKQWFSGPAKPELYFHPGDTIRMRCWTDAPGRLTFRVELLARAGQPRPAQPISSHEASFDAPRFGPGEAQEFKRVSAIDQTGNEGRPAQPTDARVEGIEWLKVDLLRGPAERRPMVAARHVDMRCPSPHLVRVSQTPHATAGGERIDLAGR